MQKTFTILLLLLSNVLSSQNYSSLKKQIENLKKDDAMKHSIWSICVMPVKKDTILAEYNSAVSVTPASTMKVATTAAALGILGKEFRFETKIQYDGTFDSLSGIVDGNLYITGGGDPTLQSKYFAKDNDTTAPTILNKWTEILKSKGIKKITGNIIGDASVFSYNICPAQWIWGDMANYYGAGASGLCYKDNMYTLYFNTGEEGSKAKINKVYPKIKNLWFVNSVTAKGSEDEAYIYGSPFNFRKIVEGTLPPNQNNFAVNGAVPDPERFIAEEFIKEIKKSDIEFDGISKTMREIKEARPIPELPRTTLFINYSPSLDTIIKVTLLHSVNLFAECILNYLSCQKSGKSDETESTDIVTDYWKKKGVDVSGFIMNDGCGLARANFITTQTQTQILRVIAKENYFKTFYNCLPIAGKSGALGGVGEGTFIENNLRGKSGYMTRARGYTGYVKNKKGEMLCFSLIANNYSCSPFDMKRKLERLLVAIVE